MTLTNPLEVAIENILKARGLKYTCNQRLDFYLPDYDMYIEVKEYPSERSSAQLESQENVILIQGKKSVEFFKDLLINTQQNG